MFLPKLLRRSLMGTPLMFSTHVWTGVRAQDKLDARSFGDCISLWPSVRVQSRGARSGKGGLCAGCLRFIPDWCRPTPLCAGVWRRPGREGAAKEVPLQECSLPSLIANEDEAFRNTILKVEVERRLTGSWISTGKPSHQLGLSDHVSSPIGPCLSRMLP